MKKAKASNVQRPVQGHYGLEFALKHMGEDLTKVFKMLEREQDDRRKNV